MKLTPLAFLLTGIIIAFAGCKDNSPQEPDAELVGTLWTLESIDVPGEPNILSRTTKAIAIQFLEDSRLEGYLDCNSYYRFEGYIDCNSYCGIYTLTDGDSLRLDMQYMTKIGCGFKSIGEPHSAGLSAVYSYEINGNRLRIYFDDSILKFRYVE